MLLIKVLLHLTLEEFDLLLKAVDYYKYASSLFEYGEHIEDCNTIRDKLMISLQAFEKEQKLNG